MLFQALVLMVLSRLLSATDFGVVAAAMVIIRFTESISQLGIGPALTQRRDLNDEHVRTAFTLSLLISALLVAASPMYIPFVAALFNMEDLTSILYTLLAIFPIRSIGLVADSLLIRDMHFSVISRIEVTSYIFGYGLVGIVLAALGYGSAALVYATLAQATLKTISSLRVQPHAKKPQLSSAALRDLMFFGGGLTLAQIGNTLAREGDNFVTGRWLGSDALGIYGRAYQLMVTPANLFGGVLDRVLFPAMAKLQADQVRLGTSYRRAVAVVATTVLPASAGMYILAPELVRVVLGAGWDEVIIPFQILAVGTLFRTSYKISDSVSRAMGAVYGRAWRQAIYAILVFTLTWIGTRWGLPGVAAGVTFALFSNFVLMAGQSLRLTAMTWKDFLFLHFKPSLLAILTAAILVLVSSSLRQLNLSSLAILFISAIALSVVLAFLLFLVPRFFLNSEGIWALEILKQRLPARLSRRTKTSAVKEPDA